MVAALAATEYPQSVAAASAIPGQDAVAVPARYYPARLAPLEELAIPDLGMEEVPDQADQVDPDESEAKFLAAIGLAAQSRQEVLEDHGQAGLGPIRHSRDLPDALGLEGPDRDAQAEKEECCQGARRFLVKEHRCSTRYLHGLMPFCFSIQGFCVEIFHFSEREIYQRCSDPLSQMLVL